MSDVVTARAAYEQALEDARSLTERARLNLGKAIVDARAVGVTQEAIAKQLGLTRERLRLFEKEYREAEAPDSAVEAALADRIQSVLTTRMVALEVDPDEMDAELRETERALQGADEITRAFRQRED
jgi:transcriptional regulator with XRE-family HTH domain